MYSTSGLKRMKRSQYVNVNGADKLPSVFPQVLHWDPHSLQYMSTIYQIGPKSDVSICLQMTLLSTTLGKKSKKLLMRQTTF